MIVIQHIYVYSVCLIFLINYYYLMHRKQNRLDFANGLLAVECKSASSARISSTTSQFSSVSVHSKCYGEKTLKLLKSVASTFAKQLALSANCPAPADPTGTQAISLKLDATS